MRVQCSLRSQRDNDVRVRLCLLPFCSLRVAFLTVALCHHADTRSATHPLCLTPQHGLMPHLEPRLDAITETTAEKVDSQWKWMESECHRWRNQWLHLRLFLPVITASSISLSSLICQSSNQPSHRSFPCTSFSTTSSSTFDSLLRHVYSALVIEKPDVCVGHINKQWGSNSMERPCVNVVPRAKASNQYSPLIWYLGSQGEWESNK